MYEGFEPSLALRLSTNRSNTHIRHLLSLFFKKSKVTSEKSILLYQLSYVPMFVFFVETAGLEPATRSFEAK